MIGMKNSRGQRSTRDDAGRSGAQRHPSAPSWRTSLLPPPARAPFYVPIINSAWRQRILVCRARAGAASQRRHNIPSSSTQFNGKGYWIAALAQARAHNDDITLPTSSRAASRRGDPGTLPNSMIGVVCFGWRAIAIGQYWASPACLPQHALLPVVTLRAGVKWRR